MGLINRLVAPWRAALAQEEFNRNVSDLLREMFAVARAQAETNARMQGSIEQIAGMILGPSGPNDSWTNDEEAQMMAEMLLRMQAESEANKGH